MTETKNAKGTGGEAKRIHSDKDPKNLKIGFFGDGEWAVNALSLLDTHPNLEIVFVVLRYTQPDERLRSLCAELGIECVFFQNVNSSEFLQWANDFNTNLFVSMSFDQIFKRPIIDNPEFGTINCHAGKLPFYRGRNILNWALINDEKEFGITVHYIDEGIDTGDIILQKSYAITDKDSYSSLLNCAYTECASTLYEAIELIRVGEVNAVSQESIHPVGMYCTARIAGDENLNWNMPSRYVFNFVRAICKPGPMARCWLGDDEICINKIEMVPNAPEYKGVPGAVLFKDEDAVYVKTMDSFVKVLEYEKNGRNLRNGDRLKPPKIEAYAK